MTAPFLTLPPMPSAGHSASRHRRRAVPALLLLATLLVLFCAPPQAPAAQYPEFIAERDFRGFVHRHMAERTARTVAEIAAMDHAARLLVNEPDLQFAHGVSGDTAPPPLPLDGLARMLFTTPLAANGIQGFPPNVRAVTHVRLIPPDNMRKALHAALLRPDLLEIHSQVLRTQRSLVAQYDSLAAHLLSLHPMDGGGKEESHVLQSIVNEMTAMDMFISLLPLYEQNWNSPQKAREELQKAHTLAPKNPLLLTALAEVLLQLDRAPAAMEHVGDALRVNPEFARAHDVKGAILLRQRLPVLAAESFAKAIALSPRNAAYRVHRASALLVLEDETGMCSEFQNACSLGDCEGFQWAKSVGKCKQF